MKKLIKLESIEVSQAKVIRRKLKYQHLLIIDYLYQFFNSGYASEFIEYKNGTYYLITLNKILEDLPILNIKKRRLQELMQDLETAKIIVRFNPSKNSPHIFIKLNLKPIQD